ncbi:hypothetical protein KQ51_01174 [Candidatus Izimaplasma bacterium HR1]|uniref:hypothetical protein n=1 Tax=Candidatus Izimoplasma sp. HR1 TaxID=1541959 RepID=UPI0004F615F2|nr:hypothetical protein KQ51_01174 [Candidatus Izimaplasma bacterium HR1]
MTKVKRNIAVTLLFGVLLIINYFSVSFDSLLSSSLTLCTLILAIIILLYKERSKEYILLHCVGIIMLNIYMYILLKYIGIGYNVFAIYYEIPTFTFVMVLINLFSDRRLYNQIVVVVIAIIDIFAFWLYYDDLTGNELILLFLFILSHLMYNLYVFFKILPRKQSVS